MIDRTLIANEVVDSRLRSGNHGIIFKIYPEKAFDRVGWKTFFINWDSTTSCVSG